MVEGFEGGGLERGDWYGGGTVMEDVVLVRTLGGFGRTAGSRAQLYSAHNAFTSCRYYLFGRQSSDIRINSSALQTICY